MLVERECYDGYCKCKHLSILKNAANAPIEVDHEKNLKRILQRFDKVALQITRRRNKRSALTITDEYDVQNLLYSLLRLYYDDIRAEEWTLSYAGSSLRIDFLRAFIKA